MLKDAHPSATRSAIVGSRRLLTGLLPCAGNFTLKTGRSALVRSRTLRNESPARRRWALHAETEGGLWRGKILVIDNTHQGCIKYTSESRLFDANQHCPR